MGIFTRHDPIERPSRASQEIIDRHARQAEQEKAAKAQRKADNAKFGRRGSGILCGWATDD